MAIFTKCCLDLKTDFSTVAAKKTVCCLSGLITLLLYYVKLLIKSVGKITPTNNSMYFAFHLIFLKSSPELQSTLKMVITVTWTQG